jgi:hypothetical protein
VVLRRLFHPLPAPPFDDVADVSGGDIVLSGQLAVGNTACCVPLSYLGDLTGAELAFAFPGATVAGGTSSFRKLFRTYGAEVAWPDAPLDRAGSDDLLPRRNGPVGHLIRDAMCLTEFPVDQDLAKAVIALASRPEEAASHLAGAVLSRSRRSASASVV